MLPRFTDREQPFNAWMTRAAPIALVILALIVVGMQQFVRSMSELTLESPLSEHAQSESIVPPGVDALTVTAKLYVRSFHSGPVEEIGHDPVDPLAELAELAREGVAGTDAIAQTRVERLRAAIVAGELDSADAALSRLDALQAEPTEDSALGSDLAWLVKHYRDPAANTLPMEVREALIERHGWFGRLAVSYGLSDSDPFRADVIGGGERIVAVSIIFGLFALLSLLAGLIAAGYIGLKVRVGDFGEGLSLSTIPGGAFLEMFDAFLLIFIILLALQSVVLWLSGTASAIGFVLAEFLLWGVVLTFLWPRLRGLRWPLVAPDLGWHKGEGVGKEILAGIIGYLAGLPLTVAVMIITSVVLTAIGEKDPQTGGYTPFQQPFGHSWAPVILGALSAVIWAPVVEETLFRGALYRALRPRLGFIATLLLTSAVFGLVHPYSPAGLIQVGVSGLVFGALREWRGSLIAPIVAHFLHNATITAMDISFLIAVN